MPPRTRPHQLADGELRLKRQRQTDAVAHAVFDGNDQIARGVDQGAVICIAEIKLVEGQPIQPVDHLHPAQILIPAHGAVFQIVPNERSDERAEARVCQLLDAKI